MCSSAINLLVSLRFAGANAAAALAEVRRRLIAVADGEDKRMAAAERGA